MKKCFAIPMTMLLLASLVPGKPLQEEDRKGETDRLKYHIVVTATRNEAPEAALATSVTLISFDELRRAGRTTLVEALAVVPGLDVIQTGGLGEAAGVFIRGANSEHTLVLMDGVEINDPMSPGRSFDFAHLSLDNIERIEIVRGPQSTLYGSDALGGVIHIITRRGSGKPRLFGSLQAGSYGTFRESAGAGGAAGPLNYSFEASRLDSRGFSASAERYGNSEADGYANTSLSGRIGLRTAENLDIQLSGRFIDAQSDIDNFGGPGGDDPNHVYDARQLVMSGYARLSLLGGKWTQRLGLSLNSVARRTEDPVDELHPLESSHGRYDGRIFKLDWQHNLSPHRAHLVTAGVEYEREQGDSFYEYESAWGSGTSLFPVKSAVTAGFYLQDTLTVADTLFVTAGVRFDRHSLFGSQATVRFAPALLLKSGSKLKGTYGTGFKAPTLYQLYAPANTWGPLGNEHLEPERGYSWDAGIEQTLFSDRLTLAVIYFNSHFDHLILYDWLRGFININAARSRGFEAEFSARPSNRITIHGAYTYTDAVDKSTGEQLLRRPRHKAHIRLDLRPFRSVDIGLEAIHVGRRFDLFPYPDRMEAEPFTLVNLAAAWRLGRRFELFGRMDNLLDTDYELVPGYGTAGRSVYVGIRVTNE